MTDLAAKLAELTSEWRRTTSSLAADAAADDLATFVDDNLSAILSALRASRPEPAADAVDEGAVERATVAAYDAFFEDQIGCCEPSWGELPDSHKDRMRGSIRAALAAAQEGQP